MRGKRSRDRRRNFNREISPKSTKRSNPRARRASSARRSGSRSSIARRDREHASVGVTLPGLWQPERQPIGFSTGEYGGKRNNSMRWRCSTSQRLPSSARLWHGPLSNDRPRRRSCRRSRPAPTTIPAGRFLRRSDREVRPEHRALLTSSESLLTSPHELFA